MKAAEQLVQQIAEATKNQQQQNSPQSQQSPQGQQGEGDSQGKGNQGHGGFDIHIKGNGDGTSEDSDDAKSNEGMSDSSAEAKWKKIIIEAGTNARARGKLPGCVESLIDDIVSGVRSAFTYTGAASVEQFADRALVGVQSAAGYAEGRPLHSSW